VTRCIYVSVDASSLACEQMKRRPWCPWGEDCDVTIPAQLPLPCWLFVAILLTLAALFSWLTTASWDCRIRLDYWGWGSSPL
jgi:hypothetical protein